MLARLRRYWWLFAAGVVLVVLVVLRRRYGTPPASGFLRRAHEADVDARLAKRRLDAEAEKEIRAIRTGLEADLGRLEVERIDRAAELREDPAELLEFYRLAGRDLDV